MKRVWLWPARRWFPGVALVLLAGGLVVGAAWAQDRTAASETVRLVIDYNDGVEKHFTALPWKAGVTVFDLLQEAKRHPHGIVLEYKDYGPKVGFMVTRIDDLANEGGGGQAKNWVYRVNDELATKACNKYQLRAADVVRWTFEKVKM